MLLAALMVRLSSRGPILFRQTRIGLFGKPFMLMKFRTMRAEPAVTPGLCQATRHDARVTWIGHFLRRSSIDELPQLFNILHGEMSVVGPSTMPPAPALQAFRSSASPTMRHATA